MQLTVESDPSDATYWTTDDVKLKGPDLMGQTTTICVTLVPGWIRSHFTLVRPLIIWKVVSGNVVSANITSEAILQQNR